MDNDPRGTYNTNIHIEFKTTTLKSSRLCDYGDVYILVRSYNNY